MFFASSKSVSVGCSKQGYTWVNSLPEGSINLTYSVEGEVQPVPSPPLFDGFSAANEALPTVGADVPEMMNWWAGKLGPWLVWNMRSPNVYCSAIWKYGC